MNKLRRQLTLFLDHSDTLEIEEIRKKYNPVQFNLIRAHVTLCREEELDNLAQVKFNLSTLDIDSVKIHLDRLIRFSEQRGVMITAKRNDQFHKLRQIILKDCDIMNTYGNPHITLMHPRNSCCTDEIFKEIIKLKIPESIIFKEISLIQQTDGHAWQVLESFPMKK